MLTVIFELWPNAGRREDYLGLAGDLRPELLRMDGFLGNERFESRREPGKMLALSFWRDEAALAGWRAHAGHRVAQARGRRDIFRDYRLRIGEAVDTDAATGRRRGPQPRRGRAGPRPCRTGPSGSNLTLGARV